MNEQPQRKDAYEWIKESLEKAGLDSGGLRKAGEDRDYTEAPDGAFDSPYRVAKRSAGRATVTVPGASARLDKIESDKVYENWFGKWSNSSFMNWTIDPAGKEVDGSGYAKAVVGDRIRRTQSFWNGMFEAGTECMVTEVNLKGEVKVDSPDRPGFWAAKNFELIERSENPINVTDTQP